MARPTTTHATACLLLLLALPALAQQLPTVAVLSTGGTIASMQDPAKGGYVPALSGEDLVRAVPAIRKIARIEVEQMSNISSSDMTPEIWLRLAVRLKALLARPEIAGAVVTHGTNTLEETAYFLDLTTLSAKPVILVGAQRPASDPDSDGPRNLSDAIRVAISPEAAGMGAMVVMNGADQRRARCDQDEHQPGRDVPRPRVREPRCGRRRTRPLLSCAAAPADAGR